MKIRRRILLILGVCAVLLGLAIWLGKQFEASSPKELTQLPQKEADVAKESRKTNVQEAPQSNREDHQRSATGSQSVTQTAPDDPRRGLAALNDVPILFDGRVEDQFGNGVSSATILASVRIYNGFNSTVDRFTLQTDPNGLFHIDHGKGEALGLMPQKEGYVFAMTNAYFKYSYMSPDRFVQDPQKPTVLKMWKLQGLEPLVRIEKEYKLPFSENPILFDLLEGRISETGGDVAIVITRAPGSLSKKNPRDWSIELKPIAGGIIESDYHSAQVAFEAPADGYQARYLVRMNQGDRTWFDNIHKVFFLKTRGGQVYSKIRVDFGINREPNTTMSIRFNGVANANSSRNWEASTSRNENPRK